MATPPPTILPTMGHRRRSSWSPSSARDSSSFFSGAKRWDRSTDNMSAVAAIELSVVIPVRNEAASLVELHREITDTLTRWGRPYELILIDDGSTDNRLEIMARIQ